MSKEHKRKLSLGDIIRKMNEKSSSSNESGDKNIPLKENEPPQETNRSFSQTFPNMDLPPQPSFKENLSGISPDHTGKKRMTDSQTNNKVDSESQPEPTTESAPASTQDTFNLSAKQPGSLSIPQPSESEDEEEFDIFRYISVLIRRKEIVVLATIVMGLYSLFSYLRSTRYYSASARLLFKPYEESIIDKPSGYRFGVDRERNFNTHLELLKSDIVLERVIHSLESKINISAITAGLKISPGETEGQENDIIELRFKYTDAETARDVLNELCKLYIEYIREVNAQEDTRLLVKLKTQVDKVQSELTVKENDLRRFKENNRMVELSKETNLLTAKLSNMELSLQQTHLDLLEGKERLITLKSQIGQQELNVVHSMTYQNPIRQRIAELELELNTLSGEYSPDHFKVKQITQQIENLKQAMQNEINEEVVDKAVSHTLVKNPIRESLLQTYVNQNVEISALETKRIAQEQIIERLNIDMKNLPLLEQEYAFLERETESLLKTLKMLKMKLEETKIKRDAKESDIKILELAKLPKFAFSSKKLSSIFIGILIGLIIGIALAFLFEYLDQSLKDPAEVERTLDIPLVGIVPLIEAENAIVNNENLTKSVLEPFRALRANLKHIAMQHNAKSFMICSAVKGEGKTTLAINLAITFAMDGKKVILIDCDLRRSQIHHLLNVSKKSGLADFLINPKIQLDEIMKPTIHENLYVITSGERPHNPSELLGIPRFNSLIQELKSRVDFIICDSPALIPVSDSMTMAPHMDCCIMVFRALWTPIKAARQAKNQLVRIGAKLGGGIYNGISHSRGYYPYYYGYYGYYAYKYSYDYDKEPKKKISIREFGLSVEKKMKSGIKNVPIILSRYSPMFISLIKNIFKKALFWILLFLLVSVIATRYFLFPETNKKKELGRDYELITYLGEKKNVKQSENVPIKIIRQDEDKMDSAITGTGMKYPVQKELIDSTSSVIPAGSETTFAYRESLSLWMQSFNAKDTSRLLSFYSQDDFQCPEGGYKEWSSQLGESILKNQNRESIITIENISAEKIKALYYNTLSTIKVLKGKDTLNIQKTMIWKMQNNQWRIIREKDKTR